MIRQRKNEKKIGNNPPAAGDMVKVSIETTAANSGNKDQES